MSGCDGSMQCGAAEIARAITVLRQSPGIMIRGPLARAGSPLASADYHAMAAPYRQSQEARLPAAGRGAAGRPVAKQAFLAALAAALAEACGTGLARAALAADPAYAAAIAAAARAA
jgi:hypothetical protein